MGLVSGSLTFFRLYFKENINFSAGEVAEILKEYSFERLYDDEKLVNYGFVPFNFPAVSSFDVAEVNFEGIDIFAVRMDEKKINKKYFDIEFENMKRKFQEENSKNFLTKMDKEFIKNALNTKLLKGTLPSTSLIEVILDQKQKCIYSSILSAKVMDILENLFRIAFDIAIYRENIVENVRKKTMDAKLVDSLMTLSPYNF